MFLRFYYPRSKPPLLTRSYKSNLKLQLQNIKATNYIQNTEETHLRNWTKIILAYFLLFESHVYATFLNSWHLWSGIYLVTESVIWLLIVKIAYCHLRNVSMELWKTHHNAPEVHGILFGNTATYQSSVTKYIIPQGNETVFYCSLSIGQFPEISNLQSCKKYNIRKIYFCNENGTKFFLALKMNTCGHI